MKEPSYHPTNLQAAANELYRRAQYLAIVYALLLASISIVVAFLFLGFDSLVLIGLLGALGGVLGYTIGQARGFDLRLKAQLALCQMHTELNTRPE